MSQFAVFVEGQGIDLSAFDTPQRRRALSQAINKTTRDARAKAAREILKQVNLPASYVSPSQGRLSVAKQASPASLEGVIRARGRNTSLARFARAAGGSPSRGGGVFVSVKPGSSTFMRRAFLIRLRQGNALTDTQFNLGLAMRLRPGETFKNKTDFVRMKNGLYLLYGPSVHQLFLARDNTGIARELEPEILADMTAEFFRLMEL